MVYISHISRVVSPPPPLSFPVTPQIKNDHYKALTHYYAAVAHDKLANIVRKLSHDLK